VISKIRTLANERNTRKGAKRSVAIPIVPFCLKCLGRWKETVTTNMEDGSGTIKLAGCFSSIAVSAAEHQAIFVSHRLDETLL
jgi:hypothetical protein